MVTTYSRGSELHIETSITLSEAYNDNIFLQEEDEIEEYITRVIIGLGLDYKSLRTELNIRYAPEYRYYANQTVLTKDGDKDEIVHWLNAQGKYILISDLLFVEASDVYDRASLTTTRDYTRLSPILIQSDRNTFTFNPYFSIRPTSLLTMNTGYSYIDVWYDRDEGNDRIDNIAYVDLNYETSQNTILTTGYRFTREEYKSDSNANDFEKHDVFIDGSYEYGEGSLLSLGVGYSVLDYGEGNRYNYPFWNAGIVHQFSSLVTSIETYRELNANPTGDPQIVDRYRLTLRSLTHRIPEGLNTIFTPYPAYSELSPADDQGRTTFNLSFYLNGFTDTTPEDLNTITYDTDYDTITYGTYASLHHFFSQGTIGHINFTAEIVEDRDPDTYSILYLAGARLIYLLTRDINLALIYAYTDSYSPDIALDNYENNRVMFEISKSF